MILYLLYEDGSFSDHADYVENPPFPAPDGATWQEGDPLPGSLLHRINSKADLIADVRAQMDDAYKALPLDLRKQFKTPLAEAYVALNIGDYELAQAEVEESDLSGITDPDQLSEAQATKTGFISAIHSIETIANQ